MDRREALKKLAAGAAIAAGTPLIVGSRAHADFGTPGCVPRPFDVTGNLNVIASSFGVTAVAGVPGYVQLLLRQTTAAFLNIACPAGFTRSNSYRWDVIGTPGPSAVIIQNGGGTGNITSQWGTDFRVRVATNVAGSTLADAGTYEVDVQFKVTCTNGARVCWRCATFTVRFDWTPGTLAVPGTVSNVSVTPALDSANCND